LVSSSFSLYRAFSLCTVFLLCSCSTSPKLTSKPNSEINPQWRNHHNSVNAIKDWNFNGRFSANGTDESWNGNIVWKQKKQDFEIQISGPLSSGSVKIEGNNEYAILTLGDDKTYSDENPEKLLEANTGLKLPLSDLQYWLRGIPAINTPNAKMQWHNNGHLKNLNQGGWKISFRGYTKINSIELPRKIFMQNSEYDVRLIIRNWHI